MFVTDAAQRQVEIQAVTVVVLKPEPPSHVQVELFPRVQRRLFYESYILILTSL